MPHVLNFSTAVDDRYDRDNRASLTKRYLNKATEALGNAGPAAILNPSSWGLHEERKQEVASRLRWYMAIVSSANE